MFEVGYGMLPYWPDVAGAPQNTIIGGATLWVLRDRPQAEYKGVAKFFAYLSKPEVQAAWHQNTGYLPITRAAFDLTRAQGFYDRNPGTAISIEQMTLKPPTENSRGVRLGSFVLIRDAIDDELEQAFSRQEVRAGRARRRGRARQPPAAPVRARQPGPLRCRRFRSRARTSCIALPALHRTIEAASAPGAPIRRNACRRRSTSRAAMACRTAIRICFRPAPISSSRSTTG